MNNDVAVWMICNPLAGSYSKAKIDEVVALLKIENIELTVVSAKDREDTVAITFAACLKMVHIIIVAGGDGTLRDVITGITNFKKIHNLTTPKLSIFPLGTANVVANRLGIRRSPIFVVKSLLSSKSEIMFPVAVDKNLFLLTAGFGMDAEIVNRVSNTLKINVSKIAYVYAILCLLLKKWEQHFIVDVDEKSYDVVSMICMQGSHYAFAKPITAYIAPESSLTVCLFKRGRRMDIFLYIMYMLCNCLEKHQFAEVVSGKKICVKNYSSQWVQIDGDCFSIDRNQIEICIDTNFFIEILMSDP